MPAPAGSLARCAAIACASLLVPGLVLAAPAPEPTDFAASFWIADADGVPVREMAAADHTGFINRARCECGQQIVTRLRATDELPDPTTEIDAFIGGFCAQAESATLGPYHRCGQLDTSPAADYGPGLELPFHPIFLENGVADESTSRATTDEHAIVFGECEHTGQSGLWLCAETNGTPGCQTDEFFLWPANGAELSGIPMLSFDFMRPLVSPGDLSAEPGHGSVRLRWPYPHSSDIAGFRVLCEQADTDAPAGLDFPAPGITDDLAGRHYINAANLCPDGPFSTVRRHFGSEPAACGNGVVDPGEACDDYDYNADDSLCAPDCTLRVSPELYAFKWDRVCSDHISPTDTTVVIDGLVDGVAYDFVLVAYDHFGNPKAQSHVVRATPEAGCGCTTGPSGHDLFTMSLVTLAILPLARRRRR